MTNNYGIEVEVRGEISGGYRLKVSITAIGMYIDGFRATESAKNDSGYWIQPPAQRVNGAWKQTVEFNKQLDFWKSLEQKCVEAITTEKVVEDAETPINLDDLPF